MNEWALVESWNGAVAGRSCRFGGGGLWQGMRAGPGHLVPGTWAPEHAGTLARLRCCTQAREEAAAVVTIPSAGGLQNRGNLH
jgi:hypothetical protein